MTPLPRSISSSEISSHNTTNDCWLVINGDVFDLTDFAPQHPGGAEIIYKYAGHDATKEYSTVHSPDMIKKELPPSKLIGVLDESTMTSEWLAFPPPATSESHSPSPSTKSEKTPLEEIINLNDFEEAAARSLSKKSMAFISGASNDNLTRDANKSWWQRIWFRPSVLQDVGEINMKTRILGCDSELPIFISPAGLAKTAGPGGELALAAGASRKGVIQCVSTTASYSLEEIMSAAPANYPFFFQLYINKDRTKTEALIKSVTKQGVKAILITVDLPVVSKREADERVASESSYTSKLSGSAASGAVKSSGIARNVGSFIDPTFSWEDIAWVRKHTHLPILLKGIQRARDARRAMEIGCQGIVLSNHGGRALDSAPPSVLTLLELHVECPEVFEQMEILIDGGIRRGSDVLKAVCLGATAVGLGRPFMYALSYGKEGVEHAVEIIKDELQTAMRLCGISDLSQATPDMLNTTELDVYLKRGSDARHPYARKVFRKSRL